MGCARLDNKVDLASKADLERKFGSEARLPLPQERHEGAELTNRGRPGLLFEKTHGSSYCDKEGDINQKQGNQHPIESKGLHVAGKFEART
jgi:hypothetical protein